MGTMPSQITSLTIIYSTVYSDADQSKHQSSASLTFVWGIHRGPVNSPHKWPVTRKMFPFDDVIMGKTPTKPTWQLKFLWWLVAVAIWMWQIMFIVNISGRPVCNSVSNMAFNCGDMTISLEWRHNGLIASPITSLTTVYSIVYSNVDQRKHQSSASLAIVRGIHRVPVNSPHKWPVTRKMFPFDDVIMLPIEIS